MISKKEIKRDTLFVVVSVIILTLVTMSVSYSAFFSVQSQASVTEWTAGELKIVVDSNSKAMDGTDFFPTPAEDLPNGDSDYNNSISSGKYATLILKNEGNLDAEFSVSLSSNIDYFKKNEEVSENITITEKDLVDFSNLIIGIYDETNGKWVDFGSGENHVYHTTFGNGGLVAKDNKSYPILRDFIGTKNNADNTDVLGDTKYPSERKYKIYIWLKENTPTTEIGKWVYLKLDIKSTTVNGQVQEDTVIASSLGE